MLRIIFCFLMLFGFQQMASAQIAVRMDDFAGFVRDQNLGRVGHDAREESNMIGSPYLQDTFQKGVILMRNNIQYSGIPLRYNIYLDEVEFRVEDGQIWALSNPEKVQLIEMPDTKLVYQPYLLLKQIKMGFFFPLVEGKIKLYRKPKMMVEKAQKTGLYRYEKPAKFMKKPDEFYIKEKTKAAELITSKKKLLELFPDKQKELSDFIKKNKVKTNDVESLIQLVEYYNEISEDIE